MQTNPPVPCTDVENIKTLNNIWKIFLLPSFATTPPPITFTIATLLKYNKEKKHITIKITLIPSVKKVHTQKNTSVAELPQKSKHFKNHSDFFLCKPSSGSYANHHPTSAIMRLHLLKLLDLFHCSLARENVNNSLSESETYQFLTCSKISSHTIQ